MVISKRFLIPSLLLLSPRTISIQLPNLKHNATDKHPWESIISNLAMIPNNNLLSNPPHLHLRILNHLFLFSDHQTCADQMDSTLLHCLLLPRCCSKTVFSNGRKMQNIKLGFLSRNRSLTSVHHLKLFLDIKIGYFTVNLRTG